MISKQSAKQGGEGPKQAINIISEGTRIKGDIDTNGDIRIDGELTGNIVAKGRLVVGPTGKITGDINCNNVEVSGVIKGKIKAGELLNLKASARVEGDIVVGKLSVEPGSVFSGSCMMGESIKLNETEKEKPKISFR